MHRYGEACIMLHRQKISILTNSLFPTRMPMTSMLHRRADRPQRCPYGASHHVPSWHKLWGRSPSRQTENLVTQ